MISNQNYLRSNLGWQVVANRFHKTKDLFLIENKGEQTSESNDILIVQWCLFHYPASRAFSLAWRLAFTKSLTLLISTMRLTSDANDFVNNKHHARDKPLLTGYYTAYTLA